MTTGDEAAAPLQIDVVRGNSTEEELAALLAVVSEAYSREEQSATASDAASRSAWELSARHLRAPLRRELGWRTFAG